MKFTSKTRILLVVLLIVAASFETIAQTPAPGGGSTVGAPLDLIAGALLVAGAAYGGKKIRSNQK